MESCCLGDQRVQEWNVSRKELRELVQAGVLTDAEVEEVISIEFNPVSIATAGIAHLIFSVFLSAVAYSNLAHRRGRVLILLTDGLFKASHLVHHLDSLFAIIIECEFG
jgi:hypothetical protein